MMPGPGEVACRWAAGALRCPEPAAVSVGCSYAEKRFCIYHQGVTRKAEGDAIMHELLAGRVPPKRQLPEEFLRLKEALHGGEFQRTAGDGSDGGGGQGVGQEAPVLYGDDEPLFAEAVAIGRGRYRALRQAGVPGDVAIDQAFFAVANWDIGEG